MTRGNIRPGGRTERVWQLVAATVLQLIKDGDSSFTIRDVIERSGIARSTIYARWPTRDALITEALKAHNSTFLVEPQSDWRQHLHFVASTFRDFSARPDEIAINAQAAQLGAGFLTDEIRRQWGAIAEDLASPLVAARAAGAIRAEVDTTMIISILFTSISGLILLAKHVPTDEYLHGLVDVLIAGCQSGDHAPLNG